MSIVYHEKSKVFHLFNKKISYVMMILPESSIGNLYYGPVINDNEHLENLFHVTRRDLAACSLNDDLFTLDDIKQEYPQYGHGNFRLGAYKINQKDGSNICEFVFESYEIVDGKPKLKGLPASYVENDSEAKTLIITLKDCLIDLKLKLFYTIYNDYPIITRHAQFINGNNKVELDQALSMCLDLPDCNYDLLQFNGGYARERTIERNSLHTGIQSIYSLRGNGSSSQFNPFFVLARKNTDENMGEAISFSLVYSGNFLAQVEVDNYHVSRVIFGIHPDNFKWILQANEQFTTPEVIITYSNTGFNNLSQSLHHFLQKRLARGIYRDKVRPILINNWEATYFDFNQEKLLALAKKAKEIGVELFVLDDGWFGKRTSDKSGLGDWQVNYDKLPLGINALANKIHSMGMLFGLWIEPESVNEDSDLYRQHPKWVLQVKDRKMLKSRNQYTLDFSNDEVVDYMCQQIDELLFNNAIDYIKWDMNRNISECYSLALSADKQQMVSHKYILNLYRMYDYLIARHPNVLFESCSAGGARFDCGMLYYAPQAWCSDNTDSYSRCIIQYGTSYGYPLSMIGSHVSVCPNHQLGRMTSLKTRANVAYFGTFGYELDLTKCNDEELKQMSQQIEFMKENRELIQFGDFYRLSNPLETNYNSWMVVNEKKTKAIVGFYECLNKVNEGYLFIKLQGLNPNTIYTLNDSKYYGDVLMNLGLFIDTKKISEDFYSELFILEAVE